MTNTAETKWRRLIADQERSGQTVREISARRGITAGTMFWWRSELRRTGQGLVPVAVVDENGATDHRGPGSSCCEVRLAFDDARTVRVPASLDVGRGPDPE